MRRAFPSKNEMLFGRQGAEQTVRRPFDVASSRHVAPGWVACRNLRLRKLPNSARKFTKTGRSPACREAGVIRMTILSACENEVCTSFRRQPARQYLGFEGRIADRDAANVVTSSRISPTS